MNFDNLDLRFLGKNKFKNKDISNDFKIVIAAYLTMLIFTYLNLISSYIAGVLMISLGVGMFVNTVIKTKTQTNREKNNG